MEPKDITDEYIKENFDLDAERKTKKKEFCVGSLVINRYDSFLDLDELENAIEKYKINREIKNEADECGKIYLDFICDDDEISIDFINPYEKLETDQEVIFRLKQREKQKLKRKEQQKKKKAEQEKQKDSEYQQYLKLKEKFENNQ